MDNQEFDETLQVFGEHLCKHNPLWHRELGSAEWNSWYWEYRRLREHLEALGQQICLFTHAAPGDGADE